MIRICDWAVMAAVLAALGGCSQGMAPQSTPRDGAAMTRPATMPEVAANESLTKLTCADFLATAQVAMTQPADDAALAAQDELANGLTWLHGYLYARKGGAIEPLSQMWMQTTAKRVYEACSAAKEPAKANLFEIAVS